MRESDQCYQTYAGCSDVTDLTVICKRVWEWLALVIVSPVNQLFDSSTFCLSAGGFDRLKPVGRDRWSSIPLCSLWLTPLFEFNPSFMWCSVGCRLTGSWLGTLDSLSGISLLVALREFLSFIPWWFGCLRCRIYLFWFTLLPREDHDTTILKDICGSDHPRKNGSW